MRSTGKLFILAALIAQAAVAQDPAAALSKGLLKNNLYSYPWRMQ